MSHRWTLSAAHINHTCTKNFIIIGFRPSMKTMDCTLKRVLINVCGDCVTRSLSGSSCCKHHRWRLYHLEYSGNLLQSVFLSSLFVTGTFDRLPLLLLCEQHTFKMGVLLLCPPMCQHQCLLNGGPFYGSLCINHEGGLPDVCQVLVDLTTYPFSMSSTWPSHRRRRWLKIAKTVCDFVLLRTSM